MGDKKRRHEKLGADVQKMDIDPERKRKTLDKIAQEARGKKIRYRPGWRGIIKVQLLSVPVSAWLLEASFLLLLPFAEGWLRKRTGVSGREAFPVLSVCTALGAAVFVDELSRHFSCRMAELEQSCYLNLSQLWLMRVCCISGLDVLAVAALGLDRAAYYGFDWFSFSVYMLTPFFLTNAALLAFFTLARNGNKIGCSLVALAAAAGLCAGFFCRWIYETIWLPVWIFLLTVALLLCAAQVKGIGKKMEEEGLCWN